MKNTVSIACADSAKAIRIAPGDDVEKKVAEALAHNDSAVVVDVMSSKESLSAFVTLSDLAK